MVEMQGNDGSMHICLFPLTDECTLMHVAERKDENMLARMIAAALAMIMSAGVSFTSTQIAVENMVASSDESGTIHVETSAWVGLGSKPQGFGQSEPTPSPTVEPTPTPEPTPEPTPRIVLREIKAEVENATWAKLSWNDTGAKRYHILGIANGKTVVDMKVRGTEARIPLVPETEYTVSVREYSDEAYTNTISTTITTPAATRFRAYGADFQNAYIAFVPSRSKDFYDQTRARVREIGMTELTENIRSGYQYAIHVDVEWRKTNVNKVLGDCVMVMRTPTDEVFAWSIEEWDINKYWERTFMSRTFDWEWVEYIATGDAQPGTYTLELYTDGLLLGKSSMEIHE